ncbi:SCO-spondin-like isoform X1 [Oculina patagonica]
MERQVVLILLFVAGFSFSFATEENEAGPAEELEDLQESLQDETNPIIGCSDRSRYWCRRYRRHCFHPFVSRFCPKTCGRCSGGGGGWSSWSAYGPCSKSCSYGYQSRSRKCNNLSSGKSACPGPTVEQRNCNEHVTCPGNVGSLAAAVAASSEGQWTAWGEYSKCSKSCGEGMQSRIRKCLNPSQPFGHKTCQGAFRQRRPCNIHPCPVDGSWSSWGQYGPCSKSCGGGVQYKYRKCKNPPPKHGGQRCIALSMLSRECNTQACSVDGNWGPWGVYSQCTKSCGGGSQYRTRTCDNPAPFSGGKHCSGPSRQTNACNTQGCPVDGNWGPWGMFGGCSKTCESGVRYRSRSCNNPAPSSGGKNCQGPSNQAQNCNTHPCAVDGSWSPWGQYSQCTKSCGGGSQYRTRTCNNPAPSGGGKQCPGLSQQSKHCNSQACTVDGNWSPWSVFGQCTKSCGGGRKYRTRKCDNPAPSNGGKNCQGPSNQALDCNTLACPVDGQWSQWRTFGVCSVTCGGGFKHRRRKCDNPAPASGGKNCQGPSFQSIACKVQACPVAGQWSSWSQYGVCSASCGGGSQYRRRKCDNPPPANSGGSCVGPSQQSRSCNSQPCKTDASWSQWSRYGPCSKRCGGGSQYRIRKCDNPPPSYRPYRGPYRPYRPGRPYSRGAYRPNNRGAFRRPYSRGAYRPYSRGAYRPYRPDRPNSGGSCIGPSRESRRCNAQPCKVDGGWSSWGPYGKCSRSCGSGGRQTRRRTCSNPAPAYGGRSCRGYSQQSRRCGSRVPCQKTCRDTRSYGYCRYVLRSYRCGRYYKSCRKTCDACNYKY